MVERIFWWLPRPSRSKYPGSFPLNFERMACTLLDVNPVTSSIIHVFGGKPDFGDTVDINPKNEPTFIGDAHDLFFLKDGSYDLVICDPPYSQHESVTIYGVTRKLERSKWIAEASRITKPGGYLLLYHRLLLPRPDGFKRTHLISIATRMNHEGRFCGVFKKEDGKVTKTLDSFV